MSSISGDGAPNIDTSILGDFNFQTEAEVTAFTKLYSGSSWSLSTMQPAKPIGTLDYLNYIQNIWQPMLVAPGETDFSTAFATPSAKNLPAPTPLSPEEQYTALLHQELDRLATEHNITPSSALYFYLQMPDVPKPPIIQQILQEAMATAKQAVAESHVLPDGWEPPQFDSANYLQYLQQSQNSTFTELLEKQNLTKEQQASLEYAYFSGDTSQLSDSELQMLKNLKFVTKQQMYVKYGSPTSFNVPVDNKEYNYRLSTNYSDMYLENLDKIFSDGKISFTDYKRLTTLHFMPEATFDNKKELLAIQEEITSQTTAAFVQENGLPPGFTAKIETMRFENYTNGIWRDTFEYNLQQSQPPLSEEEKTAIREALANPAAATKETLAKLSAIEGKTTTMVQETLQLPASWVPTEKVAIVDDPSQIIPRLQNELAIADEALKEAKLIAESLPNHDPDKLELLDYFKIVGEALIMLQEMLYTIQTRNAGVSKKETAVLLEAQMNKLEKQRKEIEQKYKKPKGGIFGKIMNMFMSIILVMATFGAAMPLAMFMAASSFSDLAGGMNFYDKAVEELCKAISRMTGDSEALNGLIKSVIYVTMITAVSAGGGPMLALYMSTDLMSKMNFIGDFVAAAGGDEQAQMIVNMLVMMTVMIVITAVSIVVTGGAGSASTIQPIINAMSGIASRVATACPRLAQAASQIGQAATRVASIGSRLASEASRAASVGVRGIRELSSSLRVVTRQLMDTASEAIARVSQIGSRLQSKMTRLGELLDEAVAYSSDEVAGLADEAAEASRMVESATEQATRASNLIQEGAETIARGEQRILDGLKMIERGGERGLAGGGDEIIEMGRLAVEEGKQLVRTGQQLVEEGHTFAVQAQRTMADAQDEIVRITEAAETIISKGKEGLHKFFAIGQAVGQIGQGVMQGAYSISQAVIYLEMAEMARRVGRLKADIENIDALIKMLKELIKQLTESLQPLSEFINSITDLQTKKYADAGSIPA